MTRPYSSDLRERVVASVAGGRNCRATSDLFGVSVATVVRWSQRQRATGGCQAKPMGGRRRLLLLPQRDWLLARIAAAPDLTVRAVRAELVERGIKISYGAVWSFLAAEGLTFKKTLHAAEQERPDVARKRRVWQRYQGRVDPTRLVFVDETWAKTNMTRTHGRAPRGQRLVARVPHGRRTTMTFLAALRSDRIDAPCVVDGPINGQNR
jgi:transposase